MFRKKNGIKITVPFFKRTIL